MKQSDITRLCCSHGSVECASTELVTISARCVRSKLNYLSRTTEKWNLQEIISERPFSCSFVSTDMLGMTLMIVSGGNPKRGRQQLRDEINEGSPLTATTQQKENRVRRTVDEDKWVTSAEIRTSPIFHVHLTVGKVCCRCIPNELTVASEGARKCVTDFSRAFQFSV